MQGRSAGEACLSGLLRILLVADSPEDRALACRALTHELGAGEFAEVDSADALDHALAQESCDVVVVDFGLHWGDGLDIVRRARARWPRCAIVVIIGAGAEDVAAKAMSLGADGYVLRTREHPLRLVPVLLAALHRTHERRPLLYECRSYRSRSSCVAQRSRRV